MRFYRSGSILTDRLGPVKFVVILTVILSLFATLCDAIFPQVLKIPSPQAWLSLSYWGLKHYFIWQVVTHFLITQVSGGFSIPQLLFLALNMYFVWVVGSSMVQMKGVKHFLSLYLGGGLFTGILISFVILSTKYLGFISGTTPALYALLTAWMILMPEIQVLVFFAIPMKVKWLITGILAMNFLVDISNGQFFNSLLLLIPVVYGYFYALIIWKTHSPYKIFYNFEKVVIRLADKLETRLQKSQSTIDPFSNSSKIYDFKTGRLILSDQEFMDACLEKISKHGRHSLSFIEKWRMRRISKRRKKQSKN